MIRYQFQDNHKFPHISQFMVVLNFILNFPISWTQERRGEFMGVPYFLYQENAWRPGPGWFCDIPVFRGRMDLWLPANPRTYNVRSWQ